MIVVVAVAGGGGGGGGAWGLFGGGGRGGGDAPGFGEVPISHATFPICHIPIPPSVPPTFCFCTTCACFPGVIATSTLKRLGRQRRSLTLIHKPMSVAIEQCGMVGVKFTLTRLRWSSTWMRPRCATWGGVEVGVG